MTDALHGNLKVKLDRCPVRELDGNKQYVHIFSSIKECMEHLNCPRVETNRTRFLTMDSASGRTFRAWHDFSDAIDDAWGYGNQTVLEMLKDLVVSIVTKPRTRLRVMASGFDDGDDIDFDKLLAGEPFWKKLTKRDDTGPVTVCFISDVGSPYTKSAEEVLWRGALTVALVDILENAGYRAEIWVCRNSSHSYTDGFGEFTAVRIKTGQHPLDMSSLVNSVSAWFYRIAMFSNYYMECHRPEPNPNLGMALPIDDAAIEKIAGSERSVIVQDVWSHRDCVYEGKEVLRIFNEGEKRIRTSK